MTPQRWLVIGAGAAGCVVARHLADAGHEVTVVEAGADHSPTGPPADVGPYFADPARIRADSIVVRTPGRDPVPYVQGLGVGGSSLINGTILPPSRLASRMVSETNRNSVSRLVSDTNRDSWGVVGEEPWAIGAVGAALLTTAPGAAVVRLARRDGRRITAGDAFLRPVLDRLRLVTDTAIDRLVLDGRRAVGATTADGEQIDADAVVVCCGAIQTPALLLRSGIDTPGIGEGVQDHPAVTFTLRLKATAVDPTVPTIAVVAPYPTTDPFGQLVALNHLPALANHGALTAGLLSVVSRGRVSLPDRDGPPLVELNQLDSSTDREHLGELAWRARELLVGDAFAAIADAVLIDAHGTTVDALVDRAHVDEWVQGHLGGHHHVTSSCAIGRVTDGAGAVDGYDRLFVGDASLFPGVPVANPYLDVIELASTVAKRMIDRVNERPGT